MFENSLRKWIDQNNFTVNEWLYEHVELEDFENQKQFFYDNPAICKSIIDDYKLSQEQKSFKLIQMVLGLDVKSNSAIGTLVGKRGAGKTAFMFWLAEQIKQYHPERPIYMHQTNVNVPRWIHLTESIDDVEEGSFLIFDEAAIYLEAKDSITKFAKETSAKLKVLRHKSISVLFATQHSSSINLDIARMTDYYLFKPLSLEELIGDTKRKSMGYMKEMIIRMQPRDNSDLLATDGNKWYALKTGLASFWSDKISRSFRKMTMPEAIDYAYDLAFKFHWEKKRILKYLKIRGIQIDGIILNHWLTAPKKAKENAIKGEQYMENIKKKNK